MLGGVDLMEAADELYGLRPDEFVGRRAELAAEAKSAGDKGLASEITKLRKPTVAAWVVDVLVRHDPDQVTQVLELGAALRQAQESMAGGELRELGRQRRQLTAAVTRQARALASDLGQRIGEPVAAQVEDTLHAAMVDEEAARAVRTGLLVKPLTVAGTEVEDVVEAVAVPAAIGRTAVPKAAAAPARPAPSRKPQESKPAKPELTVVPDNSRAIEEAEAEVTRAEEELAAAERALAKAQRKVDKREAKGLQLRAELDELRRQVAELEQRIEANEEDLAGAEDVRDERDDAVAEAQSAVERLRKRLSSLE